VRFLRWQHGSITCTTGQRAGRDRRQGGGGGGSTAHVGGADRGLLCTRLLHLPAPLPVCVCAQIAKAYNNDLRPLVRVPALAVGWERLAEACEFTIRPNLDLAVSFNYTFVHTRYVYYKRWRGERCACMVCMAATWRSPLPPPPA